MILPKILSIIFIVTVDGFWSIYSYFFGLHFALLKIARIKVNFHQR